MQKSISFFLCLLLLFTTILVRADGFKTITYEANFEVDDTAFPETMHSAKDWKSFLEKFSLKGYAHFKNLFDIEEVLEGEADLYLKNKLLLDLNHTGNQQYFWIGSKNINNFFAFNAHNYYEFMLKGYFFLGLPTNYIAVLSYPNGAVQAIRNIYNFIAKRFYVDPNDEKTEFSYEELHAIAEEVSSFFDEEYVTQQFIRSAIMDSGVFEMMYYDFQIAPEYLESFAAGESMQVLREGSKTIYQIGEYEILRYDKQPDRDEYRIYLPPSPSGFEYVAEAIVQKNKQNIDVHARFAIQMEGLDYVAVQMNSTNLPSEKSSKAIGNTIFSISGDTIGQDKSIQFHHEYIKNEDNINIKLRLRDDTTGGYPIGIKINAELKDFQGEKDPVFFDYRGEDFYSLNDSALKTVKGILLPYIIKAAIPVLMEIPSGVINDVYEYLDQSGILGTLVAK